MYLVWIVLLFFFLILIGMASKLLKDGPIGTPFLCLLAGAIYSFFNTSLSMDQMRYFSSIILILMLFLHASRMNLKVVWNFHSLAKRLLFIGFPISVFTIAICSYYLFSGFHLVDAIILGAMLSIGGTSMLTGVKTLPLRMKSALNIEGSLTGIFGLIVVSVIISSFPLISHFHHYGDSLIFIIRHLGLALVIGICIGFFSGEFIRLGVAYGTAYRWVAEYSLIFLPIAIFIVSEFVFANGYFAAAVTGLSIGNLTRSATTGLCEFTRREGNLIANLFILFFGVISAYHLYSAITLKIFLFSLFAVVGVRFIVVWLSMIGTQFKWQSKLVLSLLGGKGIMVVAFTFVMVNNMSDRSGPTIHSVIIMSVYLSIFLHTLLSYPLIYWYKKQMKDDWDEEHLPVVELPSI